VNSNSPSRFLDDLPDEVTERRSDEILSAFAWAAGKGREAVQRGKTTQPKTSDVTDLEFNQDLSFIDDDSTTQEGFDEGSRVSHPTFGAGSVLMRRGDVADIQFDSGERKSFALSIAPLKPL
jgi:hypothetical protein